MKSFFSIKLFIKPFKAYVKQKLLSNSQKKNQKKVLGALVIVEGVKDQRVNIQDDSIRTAAHKKIHIKRVLKMVLLSDQ